MPLMAPQQNAWVNPQSQFSSTAQGYTTYIPVANVAYRNAVNSQNQQQQSSGGLMSPSNVGSFKNLGQFASNGFQLPQSSFVNSIGQSLGFSNPALQGPTITGAPLSQAGSLTSTSLSSTFGAAGLGALAGSFLGKIGGNSMGGSIGGGLGAAIGNAIVPGVGGVVGGLLGGVVGGFFGGNKKPHPASAMGFQGIDPTGKMTNVGYGSKHWGDDVAKSGQTDFENFLGAQAKKYGIDVPSMYGRMDFAQSAEKGGVGSISLAKDPLYQELQDATSSTDRVGVFAFDPNDNKGKLAAYNNAWNYMLTQNGIDPASLKTTDSSTPASAIQIKPRTQGSFDQFMQSYQGGTNVQSPVTNS